MNLPGVLLVLERFENPVIGRVFPFCPPDVNIEQKCRSFIYCLKMYRMLFFELCIYIFNEYFLKEQKDYSLFLCIQTHWLLYYIMCEIYLTAVCTCKLFSSTFYSTFSIVNVHTCCAVYTSSCL